eukprot:4609926-Amphidinium_carterae.1
MQLVVAHVSDLQKSTYVSLTIVRSSGGVIPTISIMQMSSEVPHTKLCNWSLADSTDVPDNKHLF